MSLTQAAIVFALFGAASGVMQARSLERSLGSGRSLIWAPVRLGLVAVVLAASAFGGQLLWSVTGWFVGLSSALAVAYRRLSRRPVP